MIPEGDVYYPQALHKQLFNKAEYAPHDILVTMDSEATFYFPADFGRQQACNEISFADVLYHEINHGLGFATGISRYAGLITPMPILFSNAGGHYVRGITFAPHLFDKFLRVGNRRRRVDKYLAAFSKLGRSMDPRAGGFAGAMQAYSTNRLVTNFQKFMSKKKIFFRLGPGKRVPLEASYAPYDAGSSVSHFAVRFSPQDRPMRARSLAGTGSFSLPYNATWLNSPFGSGALDVLAALGYRANPNPRMQDSLVGIFRNTYPPAELAKRSHETCRRA